MALLGCFHTGFHKYVITEPCRAEHLLSNDINYIMIG